MLGLHATLRFAMHFCACIECVSTVCYAFTVIGRIQAVIWYDFRLLRYRYWVALCKISRYTRRIYLNKKNQQQQHVYVLCRRFFGFAMYSIAFSKSLLQLQFCAFDSVINSHYFCTFNKVSISMEIINITRLFSSHKKMLLFFGKRACSFSTAIQE